MEGMGCAAESGGGGIVVALCWQYLGLADGFSLTAAAILLEMIEVHVRLH
jgi:hypothetical protein